MARRVVGGVPLHRGKSLCGGDAASSTLRGGGVTARNSE